VSHAVRSQRGSGSAGERKDAMKCGRKRKNEARGCEQSSVRGDVSAMQDGRTELDPDRVEWRAGCCEHGDEP
jgi:hypothetical protein